MIRAFSATRQVRAERELLEDAAHAGGVRGAAPNSRRSGRRRRRRSVPASGASVRRPARSSASTCRRRCGRRGRGIRRPAARGRRRPARGRRRNCFSTPSSRTIGVRPGRGRAGCSLLPAITFCASSSVYSTLATPPVSVVARFASRLSWSMRRNGTVRSFGHLLAVEDLLRHPEGQRRDAGRDRDRHGLVAAGVLLLLPPGELVLAVAHDDRRRRRGRRP